MVNEASTYIVYLVQGGAKSETSTWKWGLMHPEFWNDDKRWVWWLPSGPYLIWLGAGGDIMMSLSELTKKRSRVCHWTLFQAGLWRWISRWQKPCTFVPYWTECWDSKYIQYSTPSVLIRFTDKEILGMCIFGQSQMSDWIRTMSPHQLRLISPHLSWIHWLSR